MDYAEKYAEFLKKYVEVKRPLKVVCDASNGTTSIVLKKLIGLPNLELILINQTLDAEFPAHGPNPLIEGATDMLAKKVLEVGADFGVAFDADGDRAFFVDNEGKLLPSYVIAAIWFNHSTPPFIGDELIYLLLTTSHIMKDGDIVPVRVGSFFIKEAMQKSGAFLGAEFSGHFYFKDFFGLDSGIFAMIYTANILTQQNKTLAQWHAKFLGQELVSTNLILKNTTWVKIREEIKVETATISEKTFEREGLTIITKNSWINVRTSNTEPLVRLTVGSKSKEQAELDMASIANIVKNTDEKSA